MPSKSLIGSKTFWSDVITIGVAIVQLSDCYFGTHFTANPTYAHALWVAGILGIYGRSTADTKIDRFI